MSKQETSMLKIIDIKKKYVVADQDIWALKGINLEFRTNEFVSILGPSGCGKTTMLNLIGGLDKYSEGDLVINGTSTKNFSDGDWDAYRNNSIGFVFQSYNLIPHLTILGNVELALTLSGVSVSERTQRATEVLGKVGLKDHITKKPNQLSGGQMQRVAIARALINNPDIILADEPTGALDSETSVQIMELLKEVASEKLVIMVTHNPELADEYSSRIVKFKDGLLVEDTNPFKEVIKNESNFKPKKTAMPFNMALSLSFKNLLSKKARTMITAFAGSIGICGISCVLALSTGFQSYVDKMQSDLMSSNPLEITSGYNMNFDGMFNLNFDLGDKFPTTEDVLLGDMTGVVDTLMHYNNFTPDFISHMEELSQPSFSNNINAVQMLTTLNMNVATKKNNQYEAITTKNYSIPNMADEMAMMMPATDLWSELVDNKDFIDDQYDLLCGTYPQSANEVVLFVDQYNSVIDYYLLELGLIESIADVENGKIPFDSLLGHEFRIISNQVAYEKIPATTTLFDKYSAKKVFTDTEYENGIEVKISGIMRIKENTSSGSASSTIGYTSELTELLIKNELSDKSDIVKLIENNTTTIGGHEFIPDISTGSLTMTSVATTTLESLGATTYPSTIKVFPKDFESKNVIKNHITEYNNEVTDILNNLEDGETSDLTTIIYLDAIEMMVSSMNTVIASVSYVLIAFTSISLVVSSVMIGIITYVSVIERTKEIGVLRSIGARKKDISRVFNAETILIGFTAGMIAITFTYLISIPINIIVYSLLEVPNISSLNPIAAAILVSISVILTLIAGLVPSSIAAKKDPVTALRSE